MSLGSEKVKLINAAVLFFYYGKQHSFGGTEAIHTENTLQFFLGPKGIITNITNP